MTPRSLADKAVHNAEAALDYTHRTANGALDGATHSLSQGVEFARETSQHLRDSAQHATAGMAQTIRHDPMKSVLIAAASGAVFMALLGLATRAIGRH